MVHVRGKTRKTTILIILADEDMDDGNARILAIVRYNLDVSYSDKIYIMPCLDINSVSSIVRLELDDFYANLSCTRPKVLQLCQ